MEYAVLYSDKDIFSDKLTAIGRDVDFEFYDDPIYILKTNATLLEIKDIFQGIYSNKADKGVSVVKFAKNLAYSRKIKAHMRQTDEKIQIVMFQ